MYTIIIKKLNMLPEFNQLKGSCLVFSKKKIAEEFRKQQDKPAEYKVVKITITEAN